jgi:ribosomal protein S18 acetylase RimI-like enzyme
MAIIIKKAGLSDLALLMKWRMRVLREVFAIEEDADLSAIWKNNEAYYKKHLADNTHIACFAVDQASGKIVGCGGVCYQEEMPSPDNPTGRNGYLMNIYALPEVRGAGIGKMVVAFLIADAQKRGAGKIYLESTKAAKKLYDKLGFNDMSDYMKL